MLPGNFLCWALDGPVYPLKRSRDWCAVKAAGANLFALRPRLGPKGYRAVIAALWAAATGDISPDHDPSDLSLPVRQTFQAILRGESATELVPVVRKETEEAMESEPETFGLLCVVLWALESEGHLPLCENFDPALPENTFVAQEKSVITETREICSDGINSP